MSERYSRNLNRRKRQRQKAKIKQLTEDNNRKGKSILDIASQLQWLISAVPSDAWAITLTKIASPKVRQQIAARRREYIAEKAQGFVD